VTTPDDRRYTDQHEWALLAEGGLRIGPSVVLWVVFFLWQFGPILLAASSAQFDFRGLLHFPLRFRSFWLLSVLRKRGMISSISSK